MTKHLGLILFLLSATVSPVTGASYYVDAQAAEGGNGSQANPWDDLSDITGLVAGDTVYLQRGDTWRETLTISASGSTGSPITFSAYGTGANPLLKGSVLVTGWTGGGGGGFEGDTECEALYNLESGALTTDSKATNTLANNGGVTADGTYYKQGSYSALFNPASSQNLAADDSGLTADFPLKSGDTNKKLSVACWVRFNNLPASGNRMGLVAKWANTKRSFGLNVYKPVADTVFNVVIGYNNGNSYESHDLNGLTVQTGRWYHVGATYQDSDKSYRIRVWDDTAQTVTETTGTGTNAINVEDAAFWLGALGAASYLDGRLDEVVVFRDILTATEIDQVRQGTYGGGAANQWSASLVASPSQVFFDTTRGTGQATLVAVDAQYDWYYSGGTLYTYAESDPDTLYTSVEASTMPSDRTTGLISVLGDWVTVEDIDTTQSYSRGIEAKVTGATADNVTVHGCTVSWCKDGGIVAPSSQATYLTVEDCTSHHNNTGQLENDTGHEAVTFEGTNHFTCRRNTVRDNYREGIDAKYGATNGAIYHNVTYDNGDATIWDGIIGIYMDGATSIDVYQNMLYNTAHADNFQGIVLGMENDSYPTNTIRIYSNVVHDCSQGIRAWVAGPVSTAKFSNISIVNNTIVSCGDYGLYWDASCTDHLQATWTVTNNIFWQDAGSAIVDATTGNQAFALATVSYNGFAAGQSSESLGTNYRQLASAGFTDLAGHDYSLAAGSGFIDYGTDADVPFNSGLDAAASWPGSVLTKDQDTTAWEIGAYVYSASVTENLLSYTETDDVDSTMTVTETRVTGACDNDHGTRLWKDFTAGYFTGDFTIRWEWCGNPNGSGWTAGQHGYTGLADETGCFNVVTGSGTSHSVWADYSKNDVLNNIVTLVLRVYDGTVQEDSDSTSALWVGTVYYMQLKRTGGTDWQLKVWTGGYDQTLVATLSATALTSPTYRYMVPWSARSDGSAGNFSHWYLENLYLGGGVGGGTIVPVLSGQRLRRR